MHIEALYLIGETTTNLIDITTVQTTITSTTTTSTTTSTTVASSSTSTIPVTNQGETI